MRRYTARLLVAVLTFTIGLTAVWALGWAARVESALVDRFFDRGAELRPVVFDSAADISEIYRVVVRESSTSDEVTLIVLQSESTGCSFYEDESRSGDFGDKVWAQFVNEFFPGIEPHTLGDYAAKNKIRTPLRVSNLGVNYVLVNSKDFSVDEFGGFWTKFYNKYPGSSGITSLSQIGFNHAHDQAFVYAARSCGGLCGSGEYVLLSKKNGRWLIVKSQVLWVS